MKYVKNTKYVLPYVDLDSSIVDVSLLEATVVSQAGTQTLSFVAGVDVPDLYVSSEFTADSDLHTALIKYDGTLKQQFVIRTSVNGEPFAPPLLDFTVQEFASDLGDPADPVVVYVMDVAGNKLAEYPTSYDAATATYSADVSALEQAQYFVVWMVGAGPLFPEFVRSTLIFPQRGMEYVRVVVADAEPPQSVPHVGVRVIVSEVDGTYVTHRFTDSEGDTAFYLLPGEYVFTAYDASKIFTVNNWQIEVQDSNSTEFTNTFQLRTASFSPLIEDPAAAVDTTALFVQLYRLDGQPDWGMPVHVSPVINPADGAIASGVLGRPFVVRTNQNGRAEFRVASGIKLAIAVPPLGIRREVEVPVSAVAVDALTLASSADDQFDIIRDELPTAPRRTP